MQLTQLLNIQVACPPSDRLTHVVAEGLKAETGNKDKNGAYQNLPPVGGIDLDFETESLTNAPEPATYETVYVTSHKGEF